MQRQERCSWARDALIVIAFSGALICGPATAQTTPEGQQIVHETWDFKDGAPQVTVTMAQTADGHLWLGATSGLYRFDGTRFELFRSPFGDRLLYTNVAELFAADGGLWVGYAFGGFSFLKNGRVRNFVEATGTRDRLRPRHAGRCLGWR